MSKFAPRRTKIAPETTEAIIFPGGEVVIPEEEMTTVPTDDYDENADMGLPINDGQNQEGIEFHDQNGQAWTHHWVASQPIPIGQDLTPGQESETFQAQLNIGGNDVASNKSSA